MSLTPEFVPSYVSVVNEFPEDLYDAMRSFVRSHPNWDQYRLMQVALAGFLFQQGSRERAVSRHYLDGLFDRGAAAQGPAAAAGERGQAPATRVVESPARSFTTAQPSPEERLPAGAHQTPPARPEAPVAAQAGHGAAHEHLARVAPLALPVHGPESGRVAPAVQAQIHYPGAPHPHPHPRGR